MVSPHLVTSIGYVGNHLSVTYTRSYSLGPNPSWGRTRPGIFGSTLGKVFFGGLGRNDRAKSRESFPN
jgi:hypothetical protein